jgi:WD40 repeat protein
MFLNVTKMKNLLKTLLLCGVALVIGGTVIEVYGYAKYRAFPSNPLVVLLNPSQLFLQKTFSIDQRSPEFRPVVAFSADGKFLASSTVNNSLMLWLPEVKSINQGTMFNWIKALAFHPDGQILAVGRSDGTVELIEAKTMETIRTLPTDPESVRREQLGLPEITSVAFSPDGKTIAVGSFNSTVKLWDLKTGQVESTFSWQPSTLGVAQIASDTPIAFSPDGQALAIGINDGSIKLWHPKTGQLIHIRKGHSDSVLSVAFSPDGKTLATGSSDRTMKLWDWKIGQEIRTISPEQSSVFSVTFSPDSQTIASVGPAQEIKLWNRNTGQWLRTLNAWENQRLLGFSSIAFSPRKNTLASQGVDGTVKLWQVQ